MQNHPLQPASGRSMGRPGGFTLVEILVVVIILGVLAAIVVPQFTSAASETRESAAMANLFRIREQLQLYKHQHNGNLPALATFVDQMTLASNSLGQTAAAGTAGYPLGPYLRDFPANPFTGGMVITNGGVGTSDWFYDQLTGTFRLNDTAQHAGL